MDKSELKKKLEEEVARYALFQTGVLGVYLSQSKKNKDISIKTFAKHMLRHGTMLPNDKLVLLKILNCSLVYRLPSAENPQKVRPPKSMAHAIWISIGIRIPMM
jgi:hypothetical protein